MSDQASSDTAPMPPQREIDEHNKHVTEEYRQAFTTHLQWLLSLAGAKEIFTEKEDVFIILLILFAVYGLHLWKMSRSLESECNRCITNCFKPNLICVVSLLIVSNVIGFPFKWVIICSITVVTTAISIIRTYPTLLDPVKEFLQERWKRVQNRFKSPFDFWVRGNAVDPREETGASGNSANSAADNRV